MVGQLVFVALMITLGFGYRFYIMQRMRTSLSSSGDAFTSFFERTGYQYPHMVGQPPAAQAAHALQQARAGTATGMDYIRNFHGIEIHNHSSYGYGTDANGQKVYRISNQWDARFPQQLRLGIHIADKRLDSSLRSAVIEAVSNQRRVFNPRFPHRVQTGIPAVDSRFVVYASDPAWAAHVLQNQPALVAQLDGWAELDVWVVGDQGGFADPAMKNMNAAMGGTIGNMAIGFDFGKRLELSIPVHERVAELIATLGRACA